MDTFTLADLRAVVDLCSVCIGVYCSKTTRISEPNQALRRRLNGDEADVVVAASDPTNGRIYGKLKEEGTPVSLRILSAGGKPSIEECCLVEVSLAHNQKATDMSATSDLVQLVDMTSDGVWEWFPTLNYEFMSTRFWNILGYDKHKRPTESSADEWMGIRNPKDISAAMKKFKLHVETRGRQDCHCTVAYTHKDGHEVNVKCRGAVVEWLPDGKPWRMLGTHTDITNIKRGVDAKEKLVSRISHEIRTPICAILNECETLEQSPATLVISDACEQLLTLCEDVLMAKKLHESMQLSISPRRTRLEDFFQKLVRRHTSQARKKDLALESRLLRLPPGDVMMDASKCNQVVDNLVSNAMKFTPPGGRLYVELDCHPPGTDSPSVPNNSAVTLPTAPVSSACSCWVPRSESAPDACFSLEGGGYESICTRENSDSGEKWWVQVTVTDTGHGIAPDSEEFVFMKCWQANYSVEGAGLGLSISRELAHLMSGDVSLRATEVGAGSTFTFCFPVVITPPRVKDNSPPEARATSEAGRSHDPDGAARKVVIRILSADDMLTNRKVMRRRLRALEEELDGVKVEVVDAVDGADAVTAFREKGPFDIIFMDCLMPGINGFEASREIHRLCVERDIPLVPVVAVTASVSMNLHELCSEAGMWRVITKPFVTMDLMPILQAASNAYKVESFAFEALSMVPT